MAKLFTTMKMRALAFLAAALSAASPAGAAAESPREDKMRVAMLYNIARFVWWADDNESPDALVFCVSETARIADSFQGLYGKKVRKHNVTVRIIPETETSVRGCSVVYFAEDGHLLLDQSTLDPFTLTTGEAAGFTDRGGVIEFIRVGNQQRFSINVSASREAQLEISSRLIDLAIQVE